MPASPYVALQYQGLDPSALQALEGKALGNPVEVIESALASYRLLVVNHVKTEVGKKGLTTAGELLRILDLASALYLRRFTALVGPAAVHSYVKAYQAANAGDVPLPVIYALAEQHAERMGEYFNETSKESLAQGFTKLVNQKVPARIATDRVLDAYGLTPRQMSGFVALRPEEKVYNATPRSIKARMLEYVGRSLRSRFKIFATQEVHNLEQQAQQTAWLWMQQKDLIQPNAEKVWITAKDERVCAQCGPMHGRRVAVGDQFELPNSTRLWVPGAHVNCRCEVKMVEPRLALVQKDLEGKDLLEFNEEHPRGAKGRFSAKARTKPVADAPSAALEEMIARAEALRLQPAFTEVKPLEVKSRGLQPLNRPRSGPLEAAGPPLEVPTAPLEVAGAALQPTVRAGGLEAQLQGLELSLKRQGLEAKRKRQHLEALRPVLPAVAPEPEQLGRIGIFELPEPVYHVLDPSHVDLNSVHYQFHSDTFAAGEIEAVHEADKIRSRIMSDKYNRLTNFGDNSEVVVSHYDPLQGSHFKMRLSADDVDKVITRMAWEDAGEDFPDDPIRVEFENSDGDYMGSKTLSVHDVAADLEIFPGDFSVHVAKLTHAHENISQQHSGTKRFQESWDITGQFEAAAEGSGRGMLSGENMPVKIFTLNPYDPDVGMLYTDPSQLPHVSNTGDDEDWYGETTESWEDDDDWNP